jgi:hypothetical protein
LFFLKAVDIKKSTYFSPARIENEENVLSRGADKLRFNSADWFAFATQPILPSIYNPPYYHWKKRIKVAFRNFLCK